MLHKSERGEELDRVIRTCEELLRLSRAQEKALADYDMDRFGELLELRDALISSLDRKTVASSVCATRDEGDTRMVSSKRLLVSQKLRELLCIDEQNRRSLQSQMAQTKDELAAVSRGRKALREYAYLNPQTEPYFVDRRR